MLNTKQLHTGSDVKTYADFLQFYHITPVLNNEVIKYHTFDVVSGSLMDYYDSETGEELSAEEVDYMDWTEYDEEPREIFQWYIVSASDAEMIINVAPDELIMYDWDLDMYLWGIDHYGTSWDYVPITTKFNQ